MQIQINFSILELKIFKRRATLHPYQGRVAPQYSTTTHIFYLPILGFSHQNMGQTYGRISIDAKAEPFVNLPKKCITQLVEAFHLIAEGFNLTLSEIQDIFRVSLRENFRLSDEEFSQMTKVLFNMFDHSSTSLIDSFELLSVLIVSSDMKIKEKIEKIMDLVDFRNTKEFTVHEVALAMRSCVAGMCKVTIDLERPKNSHIDVLCSLVVYGNVNEHSNVEYNLDFNEKIGLKDLTTSILTLPEIRYWLDHFNDIDEADNSKQLSDLPNLDTTKKMFDDLCAGEGVQQSALWEDMLRLCNDCDEEKQSHSTEPRVRIKLDWVYGRNTKNLTSSNAHYTSEGSILYVAGVVGVKLYQDSAGLSRQDFYMGHTNYISCITTSTEPDEVHGTLVATAEFCSQPQIHIWSAKTLQVLQCLKGFHTVGVQAVDFSPSRALLLTMGMDAMHSVAVYNWKLNYIVFTTQTATIVTQCMFIHSEDKFGACGNTFFDVWERENCDSSYERQRNLFGQRFKNQAITCMATWKNKLIVGGRDGSLYAWEGRSCTSILEGTRNKSPISALIVSKKGEIYAGTADGSLLLYDEYLDLRRNCRIKSFEKGSSYIDSLSYSNKGSILVGTITGALFELNEDDWTLMNQAIAPNSGNGSFGLDTDPLHFEKLATIGVDGCLRFINTSGKIISKEFDFEAPISTISYNTEGNRIVIGLDRPKEGQLLVLNAIDMSIEVKSTPCRKVLLDCKHSNDGKYMAVSSANHNIYIYDAISYNVIARGVGHTSPVTHIDFGCSPDCGSAISIRSNSLNNEIMFWKLDGKQTSPLSQRSIVFETNSCPISWEMRSLHQSKDLDKVQTFRTLDEDTITVVSDKGGGMKVFSFPPNCVECSQSVKAHGGCIGNMKFSKNGETLLTLGKYDTCLMQWQVMKCKSLFKEGTPSCQPTTRLQLENDDACFSAGAGSGMSDGKYSNQWRKAIVAPSNHSPIEFSSTPLLFVKDWVHGYNGSFSNNLFYAHNDSLIYPAGKVLICHDTMRNNQLHFNRTKTTITSLAMHPNRKICAIATGLSEILCIHNETLHPVQILDERKDTPIISMKFNQTGRLLATISADGFNTLDIYDWKINLCIVKSTQTTRHVTYDIAFGISDILQVGQNLIRLWSVDSGSVNACDVHNGDEEVSFTGGD